MQHGVLDSDRTSLWDRVEASHGGVIVLTHTASKQVRRRSTEIQDIIDRDGDCAALMQEMRDLLENGPSRRQLEYAGKRLMQFVCDLCEGLNLDFRVGEDTSHMVSTKEDVPSRGALDYSTPLRRGLRELWSKPFLCGQHTCDGEHVWFASGGDGLPADGNQLGADICHNSLVLELVRGAESLGWLPCVRLAIAVSTLTGLYDAGLHSLHIEVLNSLFDFVYMEIFPFLL